MSDRVAAILDKWVQLRGSGNLTADERKDLGAMIITKGEKAPRLYRGANIALGISDFPRGQAIDFGPSSTSEDEDAALPYAENGDDQPVLFVLDGARALNVQGRAEEVGGYSEREWVTAGRYYVRSTETDEDGILVVTVAKSLGQDAQSQKNANRPAIELDAAPAPDPVPGVPAETPEVEAALEGEQ